MKTALNVLENDLRGLLLHFFILSQGHLAPDDSQECEQHDRICHYKMNYDDWIQHNCWSNIISHFVLDPLIIFESQIDGRILELAVESVQFLEGRQANDISVGVSPVLDFLAGGVIIVPIADVILVKDLTHVLDPGHTGHLKQAVPQRVIVDSVEPLAILLLVVLEGDPVYQLHSPGPDGPKEADVGPPPIGCVVELRVHCPGSPPPVVVGLVVGVHHPDIRLGLVNRVHHLKGVAPNELVIPVHEHLHMVAPAVVEGCIYDVVGGVLPVQVLNVHNAVPGEPDARHVVNGAIHVVVRGIVVNEHNVIVFVFLHHDRLHHFDVPVVLNVVVAQDGNAEVHLPLLALQLIYFEHLAILLVLQLHDGVVVRQVPLVFPLCCPEHLVDRHLHHRGWPQRADASLAALEHSQVYLHILRQPQQLGVRRPTVRFLTEPANREVGVLLARNHPALLYLNAGVQAQLEHAQSLSFWVIGCQKLVICLPEIISAQQLVNSVVESHHRHVAFVPRVCHPCLIRLHILIHVAECIFCEWGSHKHYQSILLAPLLYFGPVVPVTQPCAAITRCTVLLCRHHNIILVALLLYGRQQRLFGVLLRGNNHQTNGQLHHFLQFFHLVELYWLAQR